MASLFRSAALAAACLGCVPAFATAGPDEKTKVIIEFRRAETKAADGLKEAAVPGSKDKIYLHEKAELTNEDIESASSAVDPDTKDATISVVLTKDGAKKMEKLTEEHKDKPLAVLVDGKVISAPVIRAKITEKAQITGKFSKEEVEKIVKAINGK